MDKIAASISKIAAELEQPTKPTRSGDGEWPRIEAFTDLATALDAWITDRPEPKPSRSDTIRIALTDWLTSQGFDPRKR